MVYIPTGQVDLGEHSVGVLDDLHLPEQLADGYRCPLGQRRVGRRVACGRLIEQTLEDL